MPEEGWGGVGWGCTQHHHQHHQQQQPLAAVVCCGCSSCCCLVYIPMLMHSHAAADALGGNCLTLVVGTLRQGDADGSAATLRALSCARGAVNYPVINHSRARGLLHKLRYRLVAVMVRAGGCKCRLMLPGCASPHGRVYQCEHMCCSF